MRSESGTPPDWIGLSSLWLPLGKRTWSKAISGLMAGGSIGLPLPFWEEKRRPQPSPLFEGWRSWGLETRTFSR